MNSNSASNSATAVTFDAFRQQQQKQQQQQHRRHHYYSYATTSSSCHRQPSLRTSTRLFSSSSSSSTTAQDQNALLPNDKDSENENDNIVKSDTSDENDNDNDAWEFEEYDDLTEADFIGSEWLLGTNWDDKPNEISETWVRCVLVNDDSNDGDNAVSFGRLGAGSASQPCVWGDGSKGKWTFDQASQYFSISKEYLWGKTIWAGVVEDYYFLQGTVRGWTYVTPAEVLGQWQAKRLGVDKDEAGTPPWFLEQDDDDEEEEEQTSNSEEVDDEETSSADTAGNEEISTSERTTDIDAAAVDDEEPALASTATATSLSATNNATRTETTTAAMEQKEQAANSKK